jgi:hypothetical protein
MRRSLLALSVSLAVHLAVLAGAVAFGLWHTFSLVPSVRMHAISVDVVKNLPLGATPSNQATPGRAPRVAAPKPRHRVAVARGGVTVASTPDAGVSQTNPDAVATKGTPRDGGGVDGGRRRPGDLRENGPEGSKLLALLRLDRLRAAPDHDATIAVVDQLLKLLPDRHRLIDDTGFDLYRDFDSLLIATPNPADDAVTFLAARHHLTDAALKAGLDRGAKAARKPIEWRPVDGRPVGIRRSAQSPSAPTAALDRDDRILALPEPSLAIIVPPGYAALLLGPAASARPDSSPDAGVAGESGANPSHKPAGRVSWRDLVARIDAEDSAMPDDAAFMMTATHLLFPGAPGYVVPSTRGADDDSPPRPVGNAAGPVPETITLVVGAETPFIEIIAEFNNAADADQWERDIPTWKHKFLANPLVLLSGFSALVGRAQPSRDGNTLQVRADTTAEELRRLLNLATTLARASLARPR